MDTKKKLKSLTIQSLGLLGLFEFAPQIVNEINAAIPGIDISTNPKVMLFLKASAIAAAVYGRLRANTKLV